MAERPAWTLKEYIKKESFTFEWNGGFAISQKRKNIHNLHLAIWKKYGERALEISTKSENETGRMMSAFNLKINDYYLENIFQASKTYQNGGPYLDMLQLQPKEAKRDKRHETSGRLIGFSYKNEMWELVPKTAFYDYIYACAARETLETDVLEQLREYEWFTDIEFNPKKSINCQAEGAALLKYIIEHNCWEVLDSKEKWLDFHQKLVRS